MKKYNIIYADPTWNYKDKCHAGKRGIDYKYKTVSTFDDICTLPVKDIIADNAVLFLWCTLPTIFQYPQKVMESWGFKYKTNGFTWIKTNKVKTDTFFWGMGHYTRSNVELCIIATRGNLKRISKKVHSVIMSPIEPHSKKPDETRDRIVELYGDLPRLELYARKNTTGWDAWGDECKGSIDINALARYNRLYIYGHKIIKKLEKCIDKFIDDKRDNIYQHIHNIYFYLDNFKNDYNNLDYSIYENIKFYLDSINLEYNLKVK